MKTNPNLNKYVYDADEAPFVRDVDYLFHQYKPLRLNLYSRFNKRFDSDASKKDLRSYIDEQFITLVYEYDVKGAVDFPGYIKSMLTLRVQYSYVNKDAKNRLKESLDNQDELTSRLAQEGSEDVNLYSYELFEFILGRAKLSDLDRKVLKLLLHQQQAKEILADLDGQGHTQLAIRESIKELKILILDAVQDYSRF